MPPEAVRQSPGADTVMVHVGSNDIMKGSSEQPKMDFKELIGSLLDSNKHPIISGPLPSLNCGIERFSRLLSLLNWLLDYCSFLGVTIIDNFDTIWNQSLYSKKDGIHHPNHLGSWILSQHYKAELRQGLINDPSPAHLLPTIVSLSCHNVSANVHYPRDVGRQCK